MKKNIKIGGMQSVILGSKNYYANEIISIKTIRKRRVLRIVCIKKGLYFKTYSKKIKRNFFCFFLL